MHEVSSERDPILAAQRAKSERGSVTTRIDAFKALHQFDALKHRIVLRNSTCRIA